MTELSTVKEKLETGIKAMEVQVTQTIAAIRDEKSCDIATALACECADWIDKIDADFDESLTAAKVALEKLRSQIEGYKKPYIGWKALLNKAVGEWRWKIKEEIAAANRKRIEEAEREAKAKAEREATKLEKKGDAEAAAIVRAAPPVVAPILQEVPKNKNVVDKTTWVVDIFPSPADRWKLIKFLVEGGPANMDALTINPSYLKRLAALRHEEMKNWPGIAVRPVYTSETRRDNRTA